MKCGVEEPLAESWQDTSTCVICFDEWSLLSMSNAGSGIGRTHARADTDGAFLTQKEGNGTGLIYIVGIVLLNSRCL
jgi:hypothetical protein